MRIKVPKKAVATVRRHRRYVSPATTQLAIDVQTGCPVNCVSLPGYPMTASLTSGSNGCTTTFASTDCRISLSLAPGSYAVTLTAEDASNQALSTAERIALPVVAGANNALSVALSGIPYSIVATTLGHDAYLTAALDIDGNVIAGWGVPTFAVTQTSGKIVLAQPTAATPNTFYIYPTQTRKTISSS